MSTGDQGPVVSDPAYAVAGRVESHGKTFVKLTREQAASWWLQKPGRRRDVHPAGDPVHGRLWTAAGKIVNGAPASPAEPPAPGRESRESCRARSDPGDSDRLPRAVRLPGPDRGPRSADQPLEEGRSSRTASDKVTVYYPTPVEGNRVLRPGLKFKVDGSTTEKINFASLMLALFLGTAALPHILIRYYTVSSPAAARKSTIVAIAAIGFFYILTLYMGLAR